MEYLRSQYYYDVPVAAIAQSPADRRENAKLLVRSQSGEIAFSSFKDLSKWIPQNSLMVLNNTKVNRCRLSFSLSTGGKAEVFLLRPLSDSERSSEWEVFLKPRKKLKVGQTYCEPFPFCVLDEKKNRVRFHANIKSVRSYFDHNGSMPLPPYIHSSEHEDRYQCTYAQVNGSVAAPTAGLHFTDEIIESLKKGGIDICEITLHVGAGTFLPVRSDDIRDHEMHSEEYTIGKYADNLIGQSIGKRPIIAVGTTSFRAVESFYLKEHLEPDEMHSTDLFVYPGSGFKRQVFDGIITNFHQPESTLFMLICSLLGTQNVQDMYKNALENDFRLFSFGDGSLLWF